MVNTLNNFTGKSNLWVVENLTLDELKLSILNNYFLNGTVLVSNKNEIIGDYFLIYEGSNEGRPLLTLTFDDLCIPFDQKYLTEDFSIDEFIKDTLPTFTYK